MNRIGFRMQLKSEDVIPEYDRLHREIGPDVIQAHRRAGFTNYSIFRDGLTLFGYFETDQPSFDECVHTLAQEPVMEQWWASTNPLMKTDDEGKPQFTLLPEAFHMD